MASSLGDRGQPVRPGALGFDLRGEGEQRLLVVRAADELDRELRPAVSLVSAWVSQVARDARVDTSILATRADLVALLSGDEHARLASGWRAELLGTGIRRLVEGRAGLTFDGKGGLRLVDL